MRNGLKVFLISLRFAIVRRMAFRADFFIAFSIMLVSELFLPFISILIYEKGVSFPGWSLYEVLLIQSIFVMSKGISFPIFIGMVFNIIHNVRMGTLDIMMIRPQPLLFTMLTNNIVVHDFGKFFGGIALFIFAMYHLPAPGFLDWLQFIGLFLLSLAIIFAFTVLFSVYSVRFLGSYHVFSLIDPVANFGMYPISIFTTPIKVIISSIIPVAVIGFLPASSLLHRTPDGLYITVAVAILFVAGSLYLWSRTLSKYTSAGG